MLRWSRIGEERVGWRAATLVALLIASLALCVSVGVTQRSYLGRIMMLDPCRMMSCGSKALVC